MADVFKFMGSIVTQAQPASLDPQVFTEIDERCALSKKMVQTIELDADGVVAVAFGDLSGANVVVLKADGQVVARFTSVAGATQALVVNGYLVLQSLRSAFTALDLSRAPGVNTTCKVFLGQA